MRNAERGTRNKEQGTGNGERSRPCSPFPVPCSLFLVRTSSFAVLIACGSAGPPPRRTVPGTEHVQHAPPRDPNVALAEALAAGEPIAIVRAAGLVAAAGGDLTPHRAAIWSAIDRADVKQLAAVADALGSKEPAGAVRVKLALVAAHAGDAAGAAAHLAAAQGAPDLALAPIAERAKAATAAAREPAADPGIVALLVPMSGPRSGIGRELSAAAKLAVDRGTRLVVIDTKGTED